MQYGPLGLLSKKAGSGIDQVYQLYTLSEIDSGMKIKKLSFLFISTLSRAKIWIFTDLPFCCKPKKYNFPMKQLPLL